jgi:hypothetical protein
MWGKTIRLPISQAQTVENKQSGVPGLSPEQAISSATCLLSLSGDPQRANCYMMDFLYDARAIRDPYVISTGFSDNVWAVPVGRVLGFVR